MKYEPIEHYTQAEIAKAVRENEVDILLRAVIAVALYSGNQEHAEDFCVQLSNHEHFNVRGNAIIGFGHIARIHGKLNESVVKPIIENALKDENEFVRGQAESAMTDTEHFLKWKY